MAKKKKKKGKKKRPPASRPPAASANKPAKPADADELEAAKTPSRERQRKAILDERRRARAKRRRLRNIAIALALILVIAGVTAFFQLRTRRAIAAHDELAAARASCTEVERHRGLSTEHTEGPVEYPHSPPVGGAHSLGTVAPGTYPEPFSEIPAQSPTIYEAVHSLEHGYVIVWHHGLDDDEREELEAAVRGEHKVITVPYPDLPEDYRMALTAWGWSQHCEDVDVEVVESFIDVFREATTAPEADRPS